MCAEAVSRERELLDNLGIDFTYEYTNKLCGERSYLSGQPVTGVDSEISSLVRADIIT